MPDTSPETADKPPKKTPEEQVQHGLARTSRSLAVLANIAPSPGLRASILRASVGLSELEARWYSVANPPAPEDADATF